MMTHLRPLTALAMFFAPLIPDHTALAASSSWIEADGGRLRIATKDAAANGVLEGVLEIQLKPGWKTYWRDPGEAGVPPQISVTGSEGITGVAIEYPAPEWINDGYSTYAAYSQSVMLPLRFSLAPSASDWKLNAKVFAGICEKVCIPVQGGLSVAPGEGENADAAISAAFAALPLDAAAGFRVADLSVSGKDLKATVELPATAKDAALFLAGSQGWYVGAPRRNADGTFTIPVFDRPEDSSGAISLHYTLVAGTMAVSGLVSLLQD